MSNLSLFIPRVFANISNERIARIFESNGIGKVHRIDTVAISDNCNKVYIHFEYWFDTIISRNFIARIQDNGSAKLVYDDPWFWMVLENKTTKHTSGDRKHRINLGEPNFDKYYDNKSNHLQNKDKKDNNKTNQIQKFEQELIDADREYQQMARCLGEEIYILRDKISTMEDTIQKLIKENEELRKAMKTEN
jgi:hypothetical protein